MNFDLLLERSTQYEGGKWSDPAYAAQYQRDPMIYDKKVEQQNASKQRRKPKDAAPALPGATAIPGGLPTPGGGIGGGLPMSTVPRSPSGVGPGTPPPQPSTPNLTTPATTEGEPGASPPPSIEQ
jgi:hypothetical protein